MNLQAMKTLPEDPVFVVGYPRSGTTLVQSLLTALAVRPVLLSFPETHYFNVLEKALVPSGNLVDHESLMGNRDLLGQKTGLAPTENTFNQLCERALRKELTSRDLFEWIVYENIKDRVSVFSPEKNFRWLEKTPYHANFLERVFSFYPSARAVHVIRHPVPAVISRKRNFPFNRDTSLEELARHWENIRQNVFKFNSNFPDLVTTIRYEDLVSVPRKWIAKLSRFLNISLDFARMDQVPGRSGSLILGHESWKRRNLRPGLWNANSAYREFVTGKEAARIEAVTALGMKQMGYNSFFEATLEDEGPNENL